MNYEEWIESRQSVRKFQDKPVGHDLLDRLAASFQDMERLVPSTQVKISIHTDAGDRLEKLVGYCGYAFHAPCYLLIESEDTEYLYENAGFIGEGLILRLTELGLDSCWLTISDPAAARDALVPDSPLTPAAVIAFGYGITAPDIARLDIHTMADVRLNTREGYSAPKVSLEELVSVGSWGSHLEDWTADDVDPLLQKALYAASLAPSFLNRQPYRYLACGRDLYLISSADEKTSDADLRLGLGATMFNFRIVFSYYNHSSANWDLHVTKSADELGLPKGWRPAAVYKLW